MDLQELEKYCVSQGIKCVGKSTKAETLMESRYYAGQANAFMWIAACIQNDGFGIEAQEEETLEETNTFSVRLCKAIDEHWEGSYGSFAKKCGIRVTELNQYLFDGRIPLAPTINTMAQVLGVSAEYLMGGNE